MRARPGSVPAIVGVVLTGVLLVLSLWAVFNRQRIVDQLAIWQYSPSGAVSQLATATTMTPKGQFYFYASQPSLDGTSTFNEECQRQEENSSILGCYSAGRIFIYDIQDERLAGVKEVTAAHEMLHAAYERLSAADKTQVDSLLDAEWQKQRASGDEAFRTRMEYYARTEPGERNNELHSIFATEFAVLPSELEQYFGRYFADRGAVVALHSAYDGRFSQLRSSASGLKSELDELAAEIDSRTAGYNDEIYTLNNDIDRFNARAENGGFAGQEEFQRARQALLARVETQKQQRTAIDVMVAEYEQKRTSYNNTVDESNSLTRSLDSRLAPAPAL